MKWTIFFLCSASFVFCTAFQREIDRRLHAFLLWAKKIFQKTPPAEEDLLLTTRLMASLRAGISLDQALETLLQENISLHGRARLSAILQQRPPTDFLSTFLTNALKTGIPILSTLAAFQKILQVERRIKLRAESLTSQSRAQGEVLSWLPWIMAGALILMDSDWFFSATTNSGSWFLWALTFCLLGLGRTWMRYLLEKALHPKNRQELLQEKFLPELTLRLIAQISLGQDAETAFSECLLQMKDPQLTLELQKKEPSCESIAHFRGLITHATRTGAPLREDLMAFLGDLHLQLENRWESRVQRLPVVMMAPLFLCFFPSCLLVLLALLLPLGKDFL